MFMQPKRRKSSVAVQLGVAEAGYSQLCVVSVLLVHAYILTASLRLHAGSTGWCPFHPCQSAEGLRLNLCCC